MEAFSEIWILNQEGNCIFNCAEKQNMEVGLFSNFVGMIGQVTGNLMNSPLNSFAIGKNMFFIHRDDESHLTFVIRKSSPVRKQGEISRQLKEISNQFKRKYSPNLNCNLEKRIEYFSSFRSDVEKYIENA